MNDCVWLNVEVVLLVLIESFKFSLPPDKDIYWLSHGVAKPAVVGFPECQLPLVVERAYMSFLHIQMQFIVGSVLWGFALTL
jgi:hypothetical protein